eukprot:3211062-Rhodomonas_salina.2
MYSTDGIYVMSLFKILAASSWTPEAKENNVANAVCAAYSYSESTFSPTDAGAVCRGQDDPAGGTHGEDLHIRALLVVGRSVSVPTSSMPVLLVSVFKRSRCNHAALIHLRAETKSFAGSAAL